MKTIFLSNSIEIEPENIFEEAYLSKFIFEMVVGYWEEDDEKKKLLSIIIPGKESNVQ